MFSLKKCLAGALLPVILPLSAHAAQGYEIDFSDSTGLGQSVSDVVIQNINVLVPVTTPLGTSVIRSTFNVKFTWDDGHFALLPTGIVETTSGSATGSCADTTITVTNAINGDPIPNASVEVNGTTRTTDSSGIASFTGLPAADTVVRVSATDFISTDQVVSLSCDTPNSNDQTFGLSPALASGQFRVILTWGQSPTDLDSHMTGPDSTGDRFHVYYGNRNAGDMCSLDHDDTSSFGPETVTCPPTDSTSTTLRDGLYRYSVHQYSSSGDFPTSDARVELILSNGQTYNFTPPTNATYLGAKDVWTVFELQIDNGAISVAPVDGVTNQTSSSAISRPAEDSGTRFGDNEDGSVFDDLPNK